MREAKFFIFLGSIIFLVIAINLFYNVVLFKNTLFEETEGSFLIDETFDNYELNSLILNLYSNNLSRWESNGVITAWTLINDYEKIKRIDLILKDSNGKEVKLNGIKNLNISREANKIKSNDEFPDYNFKSCKNQSLDKWEDFMLINGKNLLFWEWDETLDLDMKNITFIKALNENEEIRIFDMIVHDGLCQNINSLNGNWYSPNGLPQYGVWWVENSNLRMVNVEQEQYPSNGDHVRIISKEMTPKSFAMKVVFEVKHLPKDYRENPILKYFKETNRDNTFVRIAWDFDNVYDPGHDQTILFLSADYNYVGLQRVYPIERYFKQGQEPPNNEAKTSFKLKEGKIYEVDILVENQEIKAVIYEVSYLFLRKKAEIEYTFKKPRPDKSYPFSIESTGNIEITLKSVHIKELNITR